MGQGLPGVAGTAPADFIIADADTAVQVIKSCTGHGQTQARIIPRIDLFMRRNSRRHDQQNIRLQLLQKRPCRVYMTDMGRRECSAVDRQAVTSVRSLVHFYSMIFFFFLDSR